MAKRQPKSQPKWTDVKARLADFDQAGLLGLIHDLYAANKDIQTFLHTRFGLGDDVLWPYKDSIKRWISPDVFRRENTNVTKGKQAISDYRKAVGDPEGLAELMTFFCERAAGFCIEVGNDDLAFFDSLVSMFAQALKSASTLPAPTRAGLVARLDRVRQTSHSFGYSVGDEMDSLLLTSPGSAPGSNTPSTCQ